MSAVSYFFFLSVSGGVEVFFVFFGVVVGFFFWEGGLVGPALWNKYQCQVTELLPLEL